MKKIYETPNIEIVEIKAEDIVTASPGLEYVPGVGDGNEGDW